ncbi:hypothetical protein MMC10_002908 [Thelotrema lepadinum]|nr:hypothetical protein [Thelotrema lepadinum]
MSPELSEELGLGFGLGIPCLLAIFVTIWKFMRRQDRIQLPSDVAKDAMYSDVEVGSHVPEVVDEHVEVTNNEQPPSPPQAGRKIELGDPTVPETEFTIPFIGYTYKRFDVFDSARASVSTPNQPARPGEELGRNAHALEAFSPADALDLQEAAEEADTAEEEPRGTKKKRASRSDVGADGFRNRVSGMKRREYREEQDVMAPSYTVPRVGSEGPRADVSAFVEVMEGDGVLDETNAGVVSDAA